MNHKKLIIASNSGGSPIVSSNARGQLVIVGRYPYGPRPYDSSNPFFMDELDVTWLNSPTEAQRILNDYKSRGKNEIATGSLFTQRGYNGQYPPTNWLGDRFNQFVEFCQWLRSEGFQNTLTPLPDCLPYFDGRTFNWDLVNQDFRPLLERSDFQPLVTRIRTGWEMVVSATSDQTGMSEFDRIFQWCAEVFPNHRRYWHNPPGHLSPALSNEPEKESWLRAAKRVHGLIMQASPPGSNTELPPLAQKGYDLWDMNRRFKGFPGSPWGQVIIGPDGQPLELIDGESVAYSIYNQGYPESIAEVWGQMTLDLGIGIQHLLDGGP